MLNCEKNVDFSKIGHYVLVIDEEYYIKKKCPNCRITLPKNTEIRKLHVCDPNVVAYVRGNIQHKKQDKKFVFARASKDKELTCLSLCSTHLPLSS